MKVVKLNCKDFMTNGLEFVVQSETETHYIGAPNYHIPKVACTIIDTGEKPEQKGYCIKRTPENAEVLNEWANNKEFPDGYVFYTNKDGYAYSEKICGNYCVGELHEGFTELFTVEEFFAKVGYTPEDDYLKKYPFVAEPKLIAKAGEWVNMVSRNHNTVLDLNVPVKLKEDYFLGSDFKSFGYDYSSKFIKENEMKFEKVSPPVVGPIEQQKEEDRIEKSIDKVTIEHLDFVLRMCNIQLHRDLIDKIIDCVELIEDKGEEVTLMDVCKMQAGWKVSK